jgi:hypothetical protein
MKNLNNILSNKKSFFLYTRVGLRFIAVLLCLLVPYFFYSQSNIFLGDITLFIMFTIILFVIVIIISLYNLKIGVIVGIILFLMFILLNKRREGFTWSNKSEKNFLAVQRTVLPGIVFDTKMMQDSQTSPEELNYFIENGVWPWSPEVIKLYIDAIEKNPYIRTYKDGAVPYVRKIYSQAAILRILSGQTKEGQFLINGALKKNVIGNPNETLPSGFGDFGYKSGLIGHLDNDIIKCKSDNSGLQRISYTGKGGIFGEQTKQITDVDNNDLENLIPGFSFINGTCNPCIALKEKADYSCPFKIKAQGNPPNISDVWKYLWKVKD